MIELDDVIRNSKAFLEGKHPACDRSLPFAERIASLPLFAFDCIPAVRYTGGRQRVTAISWHTPMGSEMAAIGRLVKQLGPEPTLLDVGCANGFLSTLLAREG